MKKIYCYTIMLYWIAFQVSCEKCSDSSPPKTISNEVKITSDAMPTELVFSDVDLYTLSDAPLVQFVLLGAEDKVLAFRLKEPYSKNPGTRHTDIGLLEFGDFESTKTNDENVQKFLNTYGTSKIKALEEMVKRCEFLILQDCIDKVVGFLMIAGIAITCYMVYAIFNFVVNYSTLIKAGRQSIMSALYASSHALTGRKIFKHQRQEIEKVHFALYTKLTEQEEKLKTLEEAVRCYILLVQNKKLSECTYDYIQFPEIKKFADDLGENLENAVRNSQKSGYLTPVYK